MYLSPAQETSDLLLPRFVTGIDETRIFLKPPDEVARPYPTRSPIDPGRRPTKFA
ncbi:MAG: hypothetical protein PF508_15505 [Spirochaeta sp.]|nr:hypothetical protein [Spirochaeta sp.]